MTEALLCVVIGLLVLQIVSIGFIWFRMEPEERGAEMSDGPVFTEEAARYRIETLCKERESVDAEYRKLESERDELKAQLAAAHNHPWTESNHALRASVAQLEEALTAIDDAADTNDFDEPLCSALARGRAALSSTGSGGGR